MDKHDVKPFRQEIAEAKRHSEASARKKPTMAEGQLSLALAPLKNSILYSPNVFAEYQSRAQQSHPAVASANSLIVGESNETRVNSACWAIAFVELNDLNPYGHIYFPIVANAVVNQYGFQKYPTKAEDFNEQSGVVFEQGYTGEVVIEKLTAWPGLITVDMRTSTEDSQKFLVSLLEWMRDTLGVVYESGMIQRWAYCRQIIFSTDADLDILSPALQNLNQKISVSLSEIHKRPFEYHTASVSLSADKTVSAPLAAFTIERRAETPFSEKRYFSTAPLPTEKHVQLISEYEADLMAQRL